MNFADKWHKWQRKFGSDGVYGGGSSESSCFSNLATDLQSSLNLAVLMRRREYLSRSLEAGRTSERRQKSPSLKYFKVVPRYPTHKRILSPPQTEDNLSRA